MTGTIEHTATLVSAALGGDEAAFTRLVDSHKEVVFAIAVSRTGDFDAASDIAQEVSLRAYIGLRRLQDPARFSGWLRTIAENRCRTWVERRRHQPPREVFDSTAPHLPAPEATDRDFERAERRKIVLEAIERLAPDTRETLVLHYLEGVPTPKLATLLGLSEPAVRQRLHRGREQIRDEVAHMVDEALHDEMPGEAFTAEVEELLTRSRTRFGIVRCRDAVTDLERAAELQPDDAATALLLADAYTDDRRPERRPPHLAGPRPPQRPAQGARWQAGRAPGELQTVPEALAACAATVDGTGGADDGSAGVALELYYQRQLTR